MIRKFVNGRWEPPFSPEEEARAKARFDDMVEAGQGPGLMTDSVFLEGRCNGNQFEKTPAQGDYLRGVAEAAGQSTKGKVYLGGLANYPGDPEAWVDGRGDVQRVAEQRGYNVAGAVTVQAAGRNEPAPAVPLAPDLLADGVQEEAARTGQDVTPDLVEKVRQQRTPHWAKK